MSLLIYEVLIIFSSFILLLGVTSISYFKFKADPFIIRRLSHITSALLIVFFAFNFTALAISVTSLTFFILFILLYKTKYLNFLDGEKRFIGILTFPISIFISSMIFLPIDVLIFVYSMLILGVSDGLSGFGKYFNKNIINKKTNIGSAIFFFSTFLISLVLITLVIFDPLTIIFFALVFSIILTFVESLFKNGWDNLFISIVSGLLLFMII
jgi:hypothetical protein